MFKHLSGNFRSSEIIIGLIVLIFVIASVYINPSRFEPFKIPDVFYSFELMLWVLLASLTVLVFIGTVLFTIITPRPSVMLLITLLYWSLFYIVPNTTAGIARLNIEQLVFAKTTETRGIFITEEGWAFRNQGWPSAYLLENMLRTLLGVDIVQNAQVLALVFNLLVPVLIYLLAIYAISDIGRSFQSLAIVFFVIPQTYFFYFFGDYVYGFVLLLLLIMLTMEPLTKEVSSKRILTASLVYLSLILGNPIWSLLLLIVLASRIITYYVFDIIGKSKNAISNSRSLFYTLVILTSMFITWYFYNEFAMKAVSPYFLYLIKLERLSYALSPSAYIRTPYFGELLYEVLYYVRYSIFGFSAILAIMAHIDSLHRKDFRIFQNITPLLLSSVIPWILLKAMHEESFDNRFMVIGTLFTALSSTYFLYNQRYSKRLLKAILAIMFILTPFSFALMFYPSLYTQYNHMSDIYGGLFVANFSSSKLPILGDGFSISIITFYDPVRNVYQLSFDPSKFYVVNKPYIVFRSFANQDIRSYIMYKVTWEQVDKSLMGTHDLIYNSVFTKAWLG